MVELVDQDLLQFLGLLALRDIAADLRCPDYFSRRVAQRGDGERDVDAAAVLRHAHGLVVPDALAALQSGEYLLLLSVQLGRDEAGDRPADHLARVVAEDARRALVPRRDRAVERL